MKSIIAVLALLALLPSTAAAWDDDEYQDKLKKDHQEQEDRLRSYDQGREDAQMGFTTSGPSASGGQSSYDSGYREGKQLYGTPGYEQDD